MKLKQGHSLNYQGVMYRFDVPDNICMVLEKEGYDFSKHFEVEKKSDGKSKGTSGKSSKS